MKRIFTFLMAALMVCAVIAVPHTANAAPAAGAGKSIKILAVGDRYADDAITYLIDLFFAEGYDDVRIGWTAGQNTNNLAFYVKSAQEGTTFTYRKYDNDTFPLSLASKTLEYCVKDEAWDYIILQNGQPAPTEAQNTEEIRALIDYAKQNCANKSVKIGWQMPWPKQADVTGTEAHAAIVANLKRDALPLVDFVIPTGTAVTNAATSYLADTFYFSSGIWMNQIGRLICSHTWYSALTGKTLDAPVFTNNYGPAASGSDLRVIVESVNNAMKDPYGITRSAYAEPLPVVKMIVDGKENANGATVGGKTRIDATEGRWRVFERWEVVRGSADIDNITAKTAYVTPRTEDEVEIRGVYHEKAARQQYSGNTGVLVGFSRVDITPSMSAPMAGYGKSADRMSRGRLRPDDGTYFTAVAFSNDGKDVSYVCTVDTIYAHTYWLLRAKEEVSKRTGVPVEKISVAGTHTHSNVAAGDKKADGLITQSLAWNPTNTEYFNEYVDGMTRAIQESTADLAPVTCAKASKTRVVGQNFIRHWRYNNGKMGGGNTTIDGATEVGLPRDADQDLQVLRFYRNAPKKDVVMINFTAHATLASTKSTKYGEAAHYYLSYDYPGHLVRYVEEQDGYCHAAFYQGALGNVNSNCQPKNWSNQYRPSQRADIKGQQMGDYVLDAMEKNAEQVKLGKVQSQRTHQVVFYRLYSSANYTIDYDVITLGGSIAFAFNGCEMFDINGVDVKAGSPFKYTFVISCAQSSEYIPSFETFRYDIIDSPEAYEAREAQCNVVPGTGEDLAAGIVGVLNKLFANR